MTEGRNPFLPEAPADGQHVWSDGPSDIGGNHRCKLCGAYAGSEEGNGTCHGEFKESGKMRSWASQQWIAQRLVGDAAPRRIIRLERHELAAAQRPGVSFSGSEHFSVLLECGCVRKIEYPEWEAIHWGHAHEAGCMNACPTFAAEENDKLNERVHV